MSIHAALTHRTSYRYEAPATLGPQTIRLRPAPHCRTPILAYSLKVEPAEHFLNWQQDPQGNFLARVVFPERVDHFVVTVDLIADLATINPFDFFLEPEAEQHPFAYDPLLEDELAPFRVQPPPEPLLAALVASVPREPQRTVDVLVALNRLVQSRVAYVVRMEPGVQTPEETLQAGLGSCRDSAWLLVALLRHLGFAARFVSGYLIQLKADETPVEGPAGPAEDFTDLHAWAEAYLPGAGWVGLDATSGLMAGEGHIPLAATPSPQSAAPISGLVGGVATDFAFTMQVARVVETPRVSKPYSDEQWQEILACGRRVDRLLTAGDVRLTMGGEPTFVAAQDNEAPEWTADALGPSKRGRAARLMRRLLPLWAPGAALMNGIGKHYPGEQLPRWVLHAIWRADGEATWRDPDLLVDPDCNRGTAGVEDAHRFAVALAERLQVDPQRVLAAHEDVHYFLWREARLPANVVAEASKLGDPLARARMARIFSQGLAAPVGSVLPLRRTESGGSRRWQSGRWFLRDETLFLVPGDSHVGLRLPLESLPWAEQATIEAEFPPDPFAARDPLPSRAAVRHQQLGRADARWDLAADHPLAPPVPGEEQPDLVRTALAVEARQGLLSVFLPPLYEAEDWIALVAAIEDTAQSLGTQVMLEGYQPVEDDRLLHFSVTPDPGVIEVNVHPATSFAEHVERSEQLYEAARSVGLRAEKFMLDGRHIGTGGGNHVVLGGATVADSPFLRRPDLLKSMVSFWHNHPSLSFAFAGLFIGPMSQHPRIDEARQDSLNELEIAFAQIAPFRDVPPWLTDRLLRNILADMQGNTHRTEYCIDKMYDPAGPSGRRGLVEFRAFEMPPHSRMEAVQALLMRASVAAFWQTPYQRRLVRWGSRLHDDFMLPDLCQQDFSDALDELAGWGVKLEQDWFAPHFAFRFPILGEVAVQNMSLQLRHALEPWHVLAEDPAAGGTVRYVESSVERLQVKVEFWNPERFALVCNGYDVPLSATEREGEYLAGIRFKAWDPPSALHPALPAQTPLVFDVYDRWSKRNLGGLTYHASHPGGRSYDTYPVNANEAEARRRVRFQPFGHTPGAVAEPARAVRNLEYPRTLDLRVAAASEAVHHH